MARHKTGVAQTPDYATTDSSAHIPGGASGLPEATSALNSASSREQAAKMAARPYVKPREWMVVDGPRLADGKIRFNSPIGVVPLVPGRLVTEASHDLNLIRSQGIRLELVPLEIVDEDEPEGMAIDAQASEGPGASLAG